jgi:hypothetical protein
MAKHIRPSIIAQRSFSMLTGKPKPQARLVSVPHGQRPVIFGNKLGAAYFTKDDIAAMDEARAKSAARDMVVGIINDLR